MEINANKTNKNINDKFFIMREKSILLKSLYSLPFYRYIDSLFVECLKLFRLANVAKKIMLYDISHIC